MKNTNVKNKNSEKMYEINLFKRESWYNPLYVKVGNIPYQLDKIYFYDESGIIYTNPRSWFGDNSFNVFLKTSKEIKRKTKIDFSKKIPFIIRSKDDWDKRYDLYLPIEDFDLQVSYRKTQTTIMENIKFYDELNQLCVFSYCVKYLNNKLLDINDEYQEHLNKINSLNLTSKKEFLVELEIIQDLAKQYYEEKQNISDYTVEDYLKEKELMKINLM